MVALFAFLHHLALTLASVLVVEGALTKDELTLNNARSLS